MGSSGKYFSLPIASAPLPVDAAHRAGQGVTYLNSIRLNMANRAAATFINRPEKSVLETAQLSELLDFVIFYLIF